MQRGEIRRDGLLCVLDSRAQSVDPPLDETCDQESCQWWHQAKLNLIVMDVSQIKNVAFSLGELPSNLIRLYYYYLECDIFSSTRPTIYWRSSSRTRFCTSSLHYLQNPVCSLPDIHPSRNERRFLFNYSST